MPQRGLTALVLFFHWDSVPDPYAQRGLFNPPDPLSKGAHQASERTGAHGHRFAVLRPASDDALVVLRTVLFRYVWS